MSTNYYLPSDCKNACTHCTEEGLHIGKFSMGWQFTFQAFSDPAIKERADWEKLIAEAGKVVDEYGVHHTPEEFWKIVDETRGRRKSRDRSDTTPRWFDKDGWEFLAVDFF